MSHTVESTISKIKNGESVGDPGQNIYRGETIFTPFSRAARDSNESADLKPYRLIVTKEKRRTDS
jgi:hypothetical protein